VEVKLDRCTVPDREFRRSILVRADDLSQVMRAFNLNGWVGLVYFAFTAAAAWLA
jgi:hypothetical protein